MDISTIKSREDLGLHTELNVVCSAIYVITICINTLYPQNAISQTIIVLAGVAISLKSLSKLHSFGIIDSIIVMLPLLLGLISLESSPQFYFRDGLYEWTMTIFAYLICKANKSNVKFRKSIMFFLCVLMAVLLAWGALSFVFHVFGLREAGFGNIYYFRHLYHPFGITSNAWSEVLIMFFPLAIMLKGHPRFLYMVAIALMISLTFSKGAYISLFFLYISAIVIVKDKKLKRLIFISLCIAIIFTVICFYDVIYAMLDTLFHKNYGSNEWRMDSIRTMRDSLLDFSLFGFGIGQYNRFELMSSGLNPKYLLSVAPNIIIRLIVEYGIVGFMLISVSYVAILFRLFKNREKIIAVTFIALFVRELTYGGMQTSPIILILGVIYLAFLDSTVRTASHKKGVKLVYASSIIVLLSLPLVNKFILGTNIADTMRDFVAILSRSGGEEYSEDEIRFFLRNNEQIIKQDPYYPIFHLYVFGEPDLKENVCFACQDNSYWKFLYGLYLFNFNSKEKSYCYLISSLISNPSLIKTKEFRMFCKINNLDFQQRLIDRIKKDTEHPTSFNAVELARVGTVLTYLNQREGTSLLNKALQKSPSLVLPWKLTGDLKKYSFLKYGNYSQSLCKDELEVSFIDILIQEYNVAFSVFYGENLD